MNPMGRFFTHALATGILFGAVLILLSSRPLAAADDTPAFRQADHNLAEALASGDKKAAAALLDERSSGLRRTADPYQDAGPG